MDITTPIYKSKQQVRTDLVSDGVHHVCGLEDEQTTLLDFDARLGDVLLDGAVGDERLAERHAVLHLHVTNAAARHSHVTAPTCTRTFNSAIRRPHGTREAVHSNYIK